MKYGIYFAYWEQGWISDYQKYIKKVSDLGFDVLEVGALGIVNMSDEKLRLLDKEAKYYNIRLTAGVGLPSEYDVSSNNENVRKNGIAFMKKLFYKLDQANIRSIGGTIYSYWPVDYTKPVKKFEVRKNSIKSMKVLADEAAKYNITLLVESLNRFEQFLINDTKEAVDFVKEIDKKNVKVMLDTFHMNIEEDNIPEAIRFASEYLGHLHIGEANRKVPGKGSLPWKKIAEALVDIKYDKDVVMEPFVKTGGVVGNDIKVWRDLSYNADERQLDRDAKESLGYIKSLFEQYS